MPFDHRQNRTWLIEPDDPNDPDWVTVKSAIEEYAGQLPHIIVHAPTEEDALWLTAKRFGKGIPKHSPGEIDALHFDLFSPVNGRVSCRDIGPDGPQTDFVYPGPPEPTHAPRQLRSRPVLHFPRGQIRAYKEISENEISTIYWPGRSGKEYRYWIYGIDKGFKSTPANYIFAKETSLGRHLPIFIGQSAGLSHGPLDHHHAARAILEHGATHIHVHSAPGDQDLRLMEEEDLIGRWNPACNAMPDDG